MLVRTILTCLALALVATPALAQRGGDAARLAAIDAMGALVGFGAVRNWSEAREAEFAMHRALDFWGDG
jgi:hypothetical protein